MVNFSTNSPYIDPKEIKTQPDNKPNETKNKQLDDAVNDVASSTFSKEQEGKFTANKQSHTLGIQPGRLIIPDSNLNSIDENDPDAINIKEDNPEKNTAADDLLNQYDLYQDINLDFDKPDDNVKP